jgi:hypothetical protein
MCLFDELKGPLLVRWNLAGFMECSCQLCQSSQLSDSMMLAGHIIGRFGLGFTLWPNTSLAGN